jgi:hypothetical protein
MATEVSKVEETGPIRVFDEEQSSALLRSLVGDILISLNIAKEFYVVLADLELDLESYPNINEAMAQFETFIQNKDPEWWEWYQETMGEDPAEEGEVAQIEDKSEERAESENKDA